MIRIKLLLLSSLLLCCQILQAKEKELRYALSFGFYKNQLTPLIRNEIDSLYALLAPGNTLFLDLLQEVEKKKTRQYRIEQSALRRNEVMKYLEAKNIDPSSVALVAERNGKTAVMSNAGYRDFTDLVDVSMISIVKPDNYRVLYTYCDALIKPAAKQTFTLNRKTGGTIFGRERTRLEIASNAFVTKEGKVPECEQIELELIECYDYSSMLLNGLTTQSNGKQLETGGMVYVHALCAGQELSLAEGKKIEIGLPVANTSRERKKGMQLFNGIPGRGVTEWILDPRGIRDPKKTSPDKNKTTEVYSGDRDISGGGIEENDKDEYILSSAKLNWINCDEFLEVKEKTELLVNIPDVQDIAVYLVFTEIRSILPAYNYSPGRQVKFDKLPVGQRATLIAYTKKGDQYQFAARDLTLGQRRKEELSMEKMSETEFLTRLKELR